MPKLTEYSSELDYAGTDYATILKFFLDKADYFEFVIRTDIPFGANETCDYNGTTNELMEELAPFIFEEKLGRQWTASSTLYSPAKIYRGKFTLASLAIMLRFTSRFSDWQGPKFPDDLSLISENQGRLQIIGHESLASWYLSAADLFFLEAEVNELELFYNED